MPSLLEHLRAHLASCGAPATDDAAMRAALLAEGFDPSEPRDEGGKWTSGGGGGGRRRYPGGKGHPALAGFGSPGEAWSQLRYGDALKPRRLTFWGDGREREVEALPLDGEHSVVRDPLTNEFAVGRTADLEARAARHADEKKRESEREARHRERAAKVRRKIDPKLADGVRQALSAAPASRESLLFLLRNSGPRLGEFEAKDLLRRMVFVGDLVWSHSGGKTTYRLPGPPAS